MELFERSKLILGLLLEFRRETFLLDASLGQVRNFQQKLQ